MNLRSESGYQFKTVPLKLLTNGHADDLEIGTGAIICRSALRERFECVVGFLLANLSGSHTWEVPLWMVTEAGEPIEGAGLCGSLVATKRHSLSNEQLQCMGRTVEVSN